MKITEELLINMGFKLRDKVENQDPTLNVYTIIENMIKRDKDELPEYFKSFGLSCYYDFDRSYSWYEVSWKGERMLQIQTGTSKNRFIELMVEFFTDAWDTPPIFLASERKKKKLYEFMQLFPEFNEKIKGLKINLIDD